MFGCSRRYLKTLIFKTNAQALICVKMVHLVRSRPPFVNHTPFPFFFLFFVYKKKEIIEKRCFCYPKLYVKWAIQQALINYFHTLVHQNFNQHEVWFAVIVVRGLMLNSVEQSCCPSLFIISSVSNALSCVYRCF